MQTLLETTTFSSHYSSPCCQSRVGWHRLQYKDHGISKEHKEDCSITYLRPDIVMGFSALGGRGGNLCKTCSVNSVTVKLLIRTVDLLLLVPLTARAGPLLTTTPAFSDLNPKLITT